MSGTSEMSDVAEDPDMGTMRTALCQVVPEISDGSPASCGRLRSAVLGASSAVSPKSEGTISHGL